MPPSVASLPRREWNPLSDVRAPLDWQEPCLITVKTRSNLDFFGSGVQDGWLNKMFAAMGLASHHVFNVVTRCPQGLHRYMTSCPKGGESRAMQIFAEMLGMGADPAEATAIRDGWPLLPNVLVGARIERQQEVASALEWLSKTPAIMRQLHLTPREPIHLGLHAIDGRAVDVTCDDCGERHAGRCENDIDQVLVVGEEGFHARPLHPDWVRSLRDQAVAAEIPFCFAGWGSWAPGNDGPGADLYERDRTGMRSGMFTYNGNWVDGGPNPFRQTMDHVGAEVSGRTLDDEVWDEWPEVSKEPIRAMTPQDDQPSP